MTFWLIYICFLIMTLIIIKLSKPEYHEKIAKVMLGSMTTISAFRYGLGADYFNYVDLIKMSISQYTIAIEPSFFVITRITAFLNLDYQVVFIVYSVLTSVFIWKGFKYYLKEGYYIALGIVLYGIILDGFFYSLSGIRQYLAIAMFFLAVGILQQVIL